MSCDVFISYRRTDGIYPAMVLYRDLIDSGYNVFYDIASLRGGRFPTLLEENVRSCTDFLLIVTHDAFSNRIFDANDWVRKEIKLALETNKNIIPIFIGDARMPSELPDDIKEILEYDGVFQVDPQIIHDINNRIFREYLRSPKNALDSTNQVRLRCSVYDSTYGDEFKRLQIQANNALSSDQAIIQQYVLNGKSHAVLDIGCAYGFVGRTRFCDERFSQIIGIDKNKICIEKATALNSDDRFTYHLVDVESEQFESDLRSVMAEKGLNGFDVIFIALVLHHLKCPKEFLRRIKTFLNDDGIIIVRGSDDGTKAAYNDNGIMREIIDLTASIADVSDRFNGRKIYTQLSQAGYRDVRMYSYMRDLSAMNYEERELLFRESFSYRINYVKRLFEEDPCNPEKRTAFNRMEELLVKLQERFYDSTFWYCEYDYIGVAKK